MENFKLNTDRNEDSFLREALLGQPRRASVHETSIEINTAKRNSVVEANGAIKGTPDKTERDAESVDPLSTKPEHTKSSAVSTTSKCRPLSSSLSEESPVSVDFLQKLFSDHAHEIEVNAKKAVHETILPALQKKSSKHRFIVQTTAVKGTADVESSLGGVWDVSTDGYVSLQVGHVYVSVIYVGN